jgi:SAM-dependent methyltransferase
MKTSPLPRRVLLITTGLSLLAAGAFAQAQAPALSHPEVGQPGKDVEWVPTPQHLVDKMLEVAQLTPKDYVIDLGSGDGRMVISAAKRGARALGIEYNPGLVELARRNAASEGVTDRATFVEADLFESDFSQASIITMFLLPEINLRLRPTILDLKPGTRIVSNNFTMGEWEVDETVKSGGCRRWCTAFLWIVPAKVEGTWRLADGQLAIHQKFQMLSGELTSHGVITAVANGKLRGDLITFNVGGSTYTGRVIGDTMQGRVSGGTNRKWRAVRMRVRG